MLLNNIFDSRRFIFLIYPLVRLIYLIQIEWSINNWNNRLRYLNSSWICSSATSSIWLFFFTESYLYLVRMECFLTKDYEKVDSFFCWNFFLISYLLVIEEGVYFGVSSFGSSRIEFIFLWELIMISFCSFYLFKSLGPSII